MKQVTLHETKSPYTLSVDDETLAHESVVLEKNGQPVAVIVPFGEYEAFQTWKENEGQNGFSRQAVVR